MATQKKQTDKAPFEQHDRSHKKVAGIPLPRFGSAASGGLEYEPGPERHPDGHHDHRASAQADGHVDEHRGERHGEHHDEHHGERHGAHGDRRSDGPARGDR